MMNMRPDFDARDEVDDGYGCGCAEAVLVAGAVLLLSPIVAVGCVVATPVFGIVYTVSLYRARTARPGDVLVAGSEADGSRATVVSALGADAGVAVVEVPRHTCNAAFLVYSSARQLIRSMGVCDDLFHRPAAVESPGLVYVVARVASVPIDRILYGSSGCCSVDKADVEAMRALALWTLQRPVRLVQRAWRAHVRRRLRWAVGVVEGAALAAMYRPGGAFYQDAARRWASAAVAGGGGESVAADGEAAADAEEEVADEDEASPLLAPAPPESRHPMHKALGELARLNAERGVAVEPMPQHRYH